LHPKLHCPGEGCVHRPIAPGRSSLPVPRESFHPSVPTLRNLASHPLRRLRSCPSQRGDNAGSIARHTVSKWKSRRARNLFVLIEAGIGRSPCLEHQDRTWSGRTTQPTNRKHHESTNEVRGTVVGRSRNRWRRLLSRPSQAPTPIPSCCTAPIPTARPCSAITFPTTTKRTPGTVKWTRLCDRGSPPNPLGAGSNRDRRRARPAPRRVEFPSALGASLPLVHRRRRVTDACTH